MGMATDCKHSLRESSAEKKNILNLDYKGNFSALPLTKNRLLLKVKGTPIKCGRLHCKAFSLHEIGLVLIPRTSYGCWSTTRSDS